MAAAQLPFGYLLLFPLLLGGQFVSSNWQKYVLLTKISVGGYHLIGGLQEAAAQRFDDLLAVRGVENVGKMSANTPKDAGK